MAIGPRTSRELRDAAVHLLRLWFLAHTTSRAPSPHLLTLAHDLGQAMIDVRAAQGGRMDGGVVGVAPVP